MQAVPVIDRYFWASHGDVIASSCLALNGAVRDANTGLKSVELGGGGLKGQNQTCRVQP